MHTCPWSWLSRQCFRSLLGKMVCNWGQGADYICLCALLPPTHKRSCCARNPAPSSYRALRWSLLHHLLCACADLSLLLLHRIPECIGGKALLRAPHKKQLPKTRSATGIAKSAVWDCCCAGWCRDCVHWKIWVWITFKQVSGFICRYCT